VDDPSEAIGVRVLCQALKEPINAVISNKLGGESAPIIEKIDREDNIFAGFDVKTQEVCDMADRGIVDSLLVV